MNWKLNKLDYQLKDRGPVINIILDGIGMTENIEGNAFKQANTPVLDQLLNTKYSGLINAHGTYVGMPADSDMGNSEVGHNALGSGRIFSQGAKLVNQSIETGEIFNSTTWQTALNRCKESGTLHFLGLVSDGNVHSHINHLIKLIENAVKEDIKKIRIHFLLDGRDVPPKSGETYISQLEDFFSTQNADIKIADVGGRMVITMDRYNADWSMIERGWALHVEGKGRQFSSALEGLKTIREETDKGDQDIEPFIIAENGQPVGRIQDGDSVIFFNFRGDRSIEISRAFEEKNLDLIKREFYPEVYYAGMMEYDGDIHIPNNYLVNPPSIDRTLGEYLVNNNIPLFACSETQKYGHVTFFWNGNRSGYFNQDLEKYIEIPGDKVPFDEAPEMKASEIADKTIEMIESGKYQTGRINFANGDMVGHTGSLSAAIKAVEAVDIALGHVLDCLKKFRGIAIILADHGNCEEMIQLDKQGKAKKDSDGKIIPKTSHTLNKVPFVIFDGNYQGEYQLNINKDSSLANIAATTLNLLGYQAPEDYFPSLIQFNQT